MARRVAILFDNFGPYHLARLEAAALRFDLLAIEVACQSGEYAWDPAVQGRGFRSECLSSGTSCELSPAILASRMEAVLGSFKPDVVALPGWSSHPALSSLSWCCRHEVPAVVMSESQSDDEVRSSWKEWVKRRIVRLCSSALAGGAPHADYLTQLGMPRDQIFLGYDAVDNEYFARGAERSRKQKVEVRNRYGLPHYYFLASARFIEKKNLPRLLQAYARYRELTKTESGKQKAEIWDLVVLGDGPLRDTFHFALSTLHLEASVHLSGFKQYPELPAYYGLAGAFIHASSTEQWGLVVNEAMASGLPVLVSNRCGCAPDLVQEGINGFAFDPMNVEQLARLMLKISASSFPLSSFGDASCRIIADWGPERFASGLKAAADKALEIGPKRANCFNRLLLQLLIRRAK